VLGVVSGEGRVVVIDYSSAETIATVPVVEPWHP
jgi:hypothetical protein